MAEMNRDLVRLSDSDFDVAEGDIDPRGWKVISADGREIGEVEELIGDTNTRKVRYLECDLNEQELGLAEDRNALIPVGYVRLDESAKRVLLEGVTAGEVVQMPATISDLATRSETEFRATEREAENEFRITRSEEELDVSKRDVVTGDVVLSKHVETERVSRPVSRVHEEVDIERRPVEGGMRAGEAEFEEQEIRIPLREEEIEVSKHPEVKEELIVRKRPVVEQEEVEADLRRERIDVERHGEVEEKERPDRDDGR